MVMVVRYDGWYSACVYVWTAGVGGGVGGVEVILFLTQREPITV